MNRVVFDDAYHDRKYPLRSRLHGCLHLNIIQKPRFLQSYTDIYLWLIDNGFKVDSEINGTWSNGTVLRDLPTLLQPVIIHEIGTRRCLVTNWFAIYEALL